MQPNVHDALFKSTLSQPEHAASVLRQILPAPLAARVDFASLALSPGSYLDEALKERSSDLLFSARIGGHPAFVYLLFEHQSSHEPRMAFRLLRYMVRIWERWERDAPNARKIPMIVPVVLHHSTDGWKGGTAFEDMLDVDPETLAAAATYVVRFRFLLEDISHETDEALRARAMTALARIVLFCLRHAREPAVMVDRLGSWAGLVHEVRRAPGGLAAFGLVLRYIFAVSEPEQPDELVTKLLEAVGDEGKEEIMTAAEQLMERGRQQGLDRGREQGREQGHREVLLDLLRERFGTLSDAARARIAAAEMAELKVWTKRVLRAATLDDVFAS